MTICLPYGYYQLLRIGVTACALWLLLGRQWTKPVWANMGWTKYVLLPIAILFNPILPIQ